MIIEPKRTSLFWPVVLIGAGVILLLRNLGVLQNFDLQTLLRLWPLILVVIGLDLIFGRRFPWAGAVIGFLTIGAAVLFLYYAPTLGINPPVGVKTEALSTPLATTDHVEYRVDTSYEPVTISALSGSSDLFYATIVHRDQVNFDVAGDTEKVITLNETSTSDRWFSLDLGVAGLKWDIGLAPGVPSVINLDGGSGALKIDLEGINLESLNANLGSSASTIKLPVSSTPYTVGLESGSGSVNLSLPDSTNVTLKLDTGSGSVNISVPVGSGLQIEVLDDGSGSVNLPVMMLTQGDGTFEHDTWQTANFASASNRITIQIVNRGSGSINVGWNN
jgi:hypothetical protein